MIAAQSRIAALLDRRAAARAYPAMTHDGIVGDEAACAKSRIVFLLMDPRVIVCCGYRAGEGSIFECLPEFQATDNDEGLYRFNSFNGHPLTIVNWYHPQYSGSNWEALAKILYR